MYDYGNEVPEPKESKDRGDKLFLGFMAVLLTVAGLLLTGGVISIVIAMWQAGFINFIIWSGIFAFIAWISTIVYRRLIESDWL